MDILANPWTVGIGVTLIATVIAGLILHYIFGIGKTKQTQESPKKQLEDDSKKSSLMGDLTPQKIIYDDLGSLPPLQRDLAAQNYKGIKVSWKVCLIDGNPLPDGKMHLMMLSPGGKYPWICCDVGPEEYPQLKIMKSNQTFVVEGEIESVEQGGIKLKNIKLLF